MEGDVARDQHAPAWRVSTHALAGRATPTDDDLDDDEDDFEDE
jgi:hypothetical protein